MKKIAIVFGRVILGGGVEQALKNLLKFFDYSRYDVTLFTMDKDSILFDDARKNVRIVSINSKDIEKSNVIKKYSYRLLLHLSKDGYSRQCYTAKAYPMFDGKYDCVISYNTNWENTSTAIYRIKSKKHIAIQHQSIDINNVTFKKYFNRLLKKFDKIFFVSDMCLEQAKEICPHHSQKMEIMRNIIDTDEVKHKAISEQPDFEDNSSKKLVTVGRLSSEKGQMMIPNVCKRLLDDGYGIKWYLIGDGPQREELEREIKKYNLEDDVVLFGLRLNPYPYIKACDIYVQTSFSEAYCIATAEAKILQKPIVTTNIPVMREQFTEGENGLIVDISVEGLYNGIKTLLDHPEMREKFINNLKLEKNDNSEELQKLYDFIES